MHHSHATLVLDQLLVALPIAMLGGWALLNEHFGSSGLTAIVAAYGVLLCSRLMYVGWMT